MRKELVRNLSGKEVLGKSIVNDEGKILLEAGVVLSRLYQNKLKENGVYCVFIQDEEYSTLNSNEEDKEEEDLLEEAILKRKQILSIKKNAISELPKIFHNIIEGNDNGVNKVVREVNKITKCLMKQKSLNTNLFELNQYSEYTYIHCVDTCIMAIYIGMYMNMKEESILRLGQAALLHDIGKIKIPKEVLNKAGKLDSMEFMQIKNHPLYGYSILKSAGVEDPIILSGVLEHHERIDGKGYPVGKKGNQISQSAKIISICDVFTALSANRTYRNRYNPNEAYEYIMANIGTIFDEKIVKVFKQIFLLYPVGAKVLLSNGLIGEILTQNMGFPDRPNVRIRIDKDGAELEKPYEIDLLSQTNLVISSVIV